jgi:hypothetical protein
MKLCRTFALQNRLASHNMRCAALLSRTAGQGNAGRARVGLPPMQIYGTAGRTRALNRASICSRTRVCHGLALVEFSHEIVIVSIDSTLSIGPFQIRHGKTFPSHPHVASTPSLKRSKIGEDEEGSDLELETGTRSSEAGLTRTETTPLRTKMIRTRSVGHHDHYPRLLALGCSGPSRESWRTSDDKLAVRILRAEQTRRTGGPSVQTSSARLSESDFNDYRSC